MVATNHHSQHPRRPSNTAANNNVRSTTRRRSSLRRQSEKSSSSIIPSTAAAPTASSSSSSRVHHGRRSRSVVSANSSHHHQQRDHRRPSAPVVVEMPRLSIADRFMSGNFNSATAAAEVAPALPTPQHIQRSISPSISTTRSNSFALSSSVVSSDLPTTGNNSILSVADRFMNGGSSSTSPTPDSTLRISEIQQYRSSSISVSRAAAATTAARSLSMSNDATSTSADPVPERLTIANAFMKSSATLASTITDNNAKSRTASIGELDLSVINGNSKNRYSKSSPETTQQQQIHPLEERPAATTTRTTSIFDDPNYSLNLDLNLLTPPSPSSSAMLNKMNSRPWGSQDTLVQHNLTVNERKKPIYAQFIESEKNATHHYSDNQSFAGDYDYASPNAYNHDKRTVMSSSDDHSTRIGAYDEYDEIEIDDDNKYFRRHERQWSYDDEEKSAGGYHQESPAVSTTKLKKKVQINDDDNEEYYQSTTRGFWVGCCFVSCGQRPSQKTIEQRQKQKQKKRSEKEKEKKDEDVNRERSKNRGFGRRGWVFFTFISLVIIVLITSFLWPRTPLMRIEGASLTVPAKITETRQGVMVGNVAFESEWLVNITVDNRQNYVPTRLVQVQVLAKDALTGLVIGKGLHNDDPNPDHIVLPANTISTIQIPIRVDYQARDSTDTTFVDLTKACSPQNAFNSSPNNNGVSATSQREALPLHFWITLHFFGLDWLNYKPTVIATPATGGFACPQS